MRANIVQINFGRTPIYYAANHGFGRIQIYFAAKYGCMEIVKIYYYILAVVKMQSYIKKFNSPNYKDLSKF